MAYEKQNFLDGQIITADNLNHIEDGIIDLLMVYPVGSIYISVNSTSPAILFGGTWEILNDVFLLAAGSYANAGTFGGEAEHTLTVDEMPKHNHDFQASYSDIATGSEVNGKILAGGDSNQWLWNFAKTNDSGWNAPHNNMPPYLAVYMWARVE